MSDETVGIEARQATARVRTDRDPLGRCAAREIALERLGSRIRVFVLGDRERRDVDGGTLSREVERFGEQRTTPVDVRRVEYPRRDFALLQRLANQLETACAVAEMQVQDPGLAGHHAGDVTFGG